MSHICIQILYVLIKHVLALILIFQMLDDQITYTYV